LPVFFAHYVASQAAWQKLPLNLKGLFTLKSLSMLVCWCILFMVRSCDWTGGGNDLLAWSLAVRPDSGVERPKGVAENRFSQTRNATDMKFEQVTGSTIGQLWTTVEPPIELATSLEEAAQALATALYTQFAESTILTRIYVTVPFAALPPMTRAFVEGLPGAAAALTGTTPVLSLAGTQGQKVEWNDRRKSKQHRAIPLISAEFVDGTPMIARLLRELGVPLDWIDSHDARRLVTSIGSTAGLFYVEDAVRAVDDRGRKVIPAVNFVFANDVKSVFGTGGAYAGGQTLVVVVFFCREVVTRATAEMFLPLVDLFRDKTASLVGPAKVFAPPATRK
jgi:hypothetical protein